MDDGERFKETFTNAVMEMLRSSIQAEDLRERMLEYNWKCILKKEINLYKIAGHEKRSAEVENE